MLSPLGCAPVSWQSPGIERDLFGDLDPPGKLGIWIAGRKRESAISRHDEWIYSRRGKDTASPGKEADHPSRRENPRYPA